MTDASNIAGAANAYLQQGNSTVLVAAKAKLPPKSMRPTITTPRRELEAMLMGSKLAKTLLDTYNPIYPQLSLHCWSDSEICLSWLSSLKSVNVFVNNRTKLIRELIPDAPWRHVRSADNAADLTSRGMTGQEYLDSPLYWHGPPLLTKETDYPEPYSLTLDPTPVVTLATVTEPIEANSFFFLNF
jgi:hypothetical protein